MSTLSAPSMGVSRRPVFSGRGATEGYRYIHPSVHSCISLSFTDPSPSSLSLSLISSPWTDTPLAKANTNMIASLNQMADSQEQVEGKKEEDGNQMGLSPLSISKTIGQFNQDSRVASQAGKESNGPARILLCMPVWEHAYFRDFGVLGREEYARRFWDRVNWDRVYLRQNQSSLI